MDNDNTDKIFINAPIEYEKIKINKWRVKEGAPINVGCVVLLYQDPVDKSIHKLKSNRAGVVKQRLCRDGQILEKGAPILELSECMHTTVIKDMCADCGADLRQNENGNTSEASVPMVHSVPDLKVTQKLAQKLGHDDTRRLLNDRKLVLLVDLDQTIIHTTNDNVPNNIKNIYHFQLYGPHSPWYHTRLRPGTLKFLENMSSYYELHICTFGARNYAHMIAQILDPDGKYFSHRILSRDECFNATSKTDNLKALFPNGDSMVCIIDDREDVWNMASNLIQVKPYHFFQHTGDINAPPGLSKHELDGEGLDFKDLDKLTDKEKEDATEKRLDSEDNESTPEAETEVKPTKDSEEIEECVEAAVTETAEDRSSQITKEPSIETDSEESKEKELKSEKEENYLEEDKENDGELTSEKSVEENPQDLGEEPSTSSSSISSAKIKVTTDAAHKEIEIEDPDDYLYDLEHILKNIHTRFYSIYDETNEIPDLKIIVPKIRSEVLRGLNLVFSGLVPTAMKLESSRAYFIAKSLGANVSQNIGEDTTHIVAVTSGTYKVNAAKKNPKIKIVNANWLWSCAERWEHVEEKIFPLDRKTKGKQRQPPAHCHSPEHVVDYSVKSEISAWSTAQQKELEGPTKFMDTINPLLSFSNADLADMNKEFDQFFESDDSSSDDDEHVNIENPPVDKNLRKRKREEQGEDRVRQFFTEDKTNEMLGNVLQTKICPTSKKRQDRGDCEENDSEEKSSIDSNNEDVDDEEDDDDEMPSAKFRRGEDLPSDLEVGSDSENSDKNNPDSEDDGDWNMMGAALEREFLGLED